MTTIICVVLATTNDNLNKTSGNVCVNYNTTLCGDRFTLKGANIILLYDLAKDSSYMLPFSLHKTGPVGRIY
jgi:hypothetical protein